MTTIEKPGKDQGDASDLVRRAFRDAVEPPSVTEEVIGRSFSADSIQYVDGKRWTTANSSCIWSKQKATVASIQVTVITILGAGETVFTNHEVRAAKTFGETLHVKVIAQFTVRGGRIVACDELTHMISGPVHDRDLGSSH